MLVPVSFETNDRTWEVPVMVKPVDERTMVEGDLPRLRKAIIKIVDTDQLEDLRVVNTVSELIGHPL